MQVVQTKLTLDQRSLGWDYARHDPLRAFLFNAGGRRIRTRIERCVRLFSAGIARAPDFTRNAVLTRLFPEGPSHDATQEVANAVATYLRTGRIMALPPTGIGRYQLSLKLGAKWLPTCDVAGLMGYAGKQEPMLPMLVEGSPLPAAGKSSRAEMSLVRPTHHFVILPMGSMFYVIDGARGMVFDSVRSYLDNVMLPGHFGESRIRMKWFRVLLGGREIETGGIAGQDDWTAQ